MWAWGENSRPEGGVRKCKCAVPICAKQMLPPTTWNQLVSSRVCIAHSHKRVNLLIELFVWLCDFVLRRSGPQAGWSSFIIDRVVLMIKATVNLRGIRFMSWQTWPRKTSLFLTCVFLFFGKYISQHDVCGVPQCQTPFQLWNGRRLKKFHCTFLSSLIFLMFDH